MSEDNQEQTKEVPVGAKIISVLYYINAAAMIVALIFAIIGMISINPLFIILIIFSLGFMILFFLMGKGLWRGKNWARITAAIFAIIGVIFSILAIIVFSVVFGNANDVQYMGNILSIVGPAQIVQMIIIIAINALIAGYLLFSKKVKEAFQ